jgi:uncharacterized membrane protein YfcA
MNQQQQPAIPNKPRIDALTGVIAMIVSIFGGGYIGLLFDNSYVAVIAMIMIFAVIVNIVRRRRMARAAAQAAEVPTEPYDRYVEYGVTGDPRFQE